MRGIFFFSSNLLTNWRVKNYYILSKVSNEDRPSGVSNPASAPPTKSFSRCKPNFKWALRLQPPDLATSRGHTIPNPIWPNQLNTITHCTTRKGCTPGNPNSYKIQQVENKTNPTFSRSSTEDFQQNLKMGSTAELANQSTRDCYDLRNHNVPEHMQHVEHMQHMQHAQHKRVHDDSIYQNCVTYANIR